MYTYVFYTYFIVATRSKCPTNVIERVIAPLDTVGLYIYILNFVSFFVYTRA